MQMAGVNRLIVWNRAVRTRFMTAILVPVLLGAAVAHDDLARAGDLARWSWGVFWLALLGAAFAQAGTNLANDYADHVSGNDAFNTSPSAFNGGSRVIQMGLVSARQVLLASIGCFSATVAIGLYLNAALGGGPFAATPVLFIGLAGCFLGLGYSLDPLRLGYRGMGEIAIALGFGPVTVLGMHYVMSAPELPAWAWPKPLLASVPLAIFVMQIIWINQFQDAPADARAGKRNWVVRMSERPGLEFRYEGALAIYRGLSAAGFAAVAVLGVLGLADDRLASPYAFIALSALPLTIYANHEAGEWLRRWNAPDADRHHLPYELLPVNAMTVANHLASGMLLVLAYWI